MIVYLLFLKYSRLIYFGKASLMIVSYSYVKLLLPICIYLNEFGTCKYKLIFRTLIELIKFAYKSRTWRFVLNVKSLKNFAPALSSIELSFKLKFYNVVLSFIACDRYLEPSYPIELLAKFKWVNILFFSKNFAIFRAPWSPKLLYDKLSSTKVVLSIRPGQINLNKSSSIKFPDKFNEIWIK